MSWLFKPSPAASLTSSPEQQHQRNVGVKEDFSAIGKTIGRQLRGVATFLAPPPVSSSFDTQVVSDTGGGGSASSKALVGIKNDLAEIGGSLKSGFSKFTSSFIPFQGNVQRKDHDEDDEAEGDCEDYVAGLSDEIIHFVDQLSTRQEFWTDFPLPIGNDFRLSDEHRQHVSVISEIVPRIATLKASLQSFMSGNQFWLIYFILLLPRLSDEDMEILSSEQIVETRNLLLQKIKNKNTVKLSDSHSTCGDVSDGTEARDTTSPLHKQETTEIVTATKGLDIQEQVRTEQWLEDTDADTSTSGNDRKKFELIEETSFSDLEADDSDLSQRLSASNRAHIPRTISAAGSTDWIQLQDSYIPEGGANKTRQSFSRDKDSDIESAEWLNVDEFD